MQDRAERPCFLGARLHSKHIIKATEFLARPVLGRPHHILQFGQRRPLNLFTDQTLQAYVVQPAGDCILQLSYDLTI